jgi:hypothetical protein
MTPSEGSPSPEPNLESAEYRDRLMRKLNCLIAVLEVANAKVRQALAQDGVDTEKLLRIKRNLQDTLDVCLKAKAALERREPLPASVAQGLARLVPAEATGNPMVSEAPRRRGRGVEMTSRQEWKKFRRMGRIEPAMVSACDFDDLARRLQGG